MRIYLEFEEDNNEPSIISSAIEVVLVSNDDYEYLIPKELESEFEAMNAQIEDVYQSDEVLEEDEIADNEYVHQLQSDFNDKFDQYRKEGTLPKLYARINYQEDL